MTADFVYVRPHGSRELYVSGYTPRELDGWAARVAGWVRGRPSRDVYVFFDNDAEVRAPLDALALRARVDSLLTNAGGRRVRDAARAAGTAGGRRGRA